MDLYCTKLAFLCVFVLQVSGQNPGPVVTLPQGGQVRGVIEKIEDARVYSAFRGIPYAKPPVGDLKLKAPEKHEGWSSTLDATRFKSVCPQWDIRGNIIGDEDCLFINVFTPSELKSGSASSNDFPVMVFIHGGDFQKGSAQPYGAERLIKNGVVVVTFNYRLGILGFLSTGDAACPGNLGLKDQVMALQWVKTNIQAFGGKPDLVTIFGQNAGAVSVLLHILSPMSKELFQHAITQSGSPLCDWSLEERPMEYAVEIADRLKCSTKSNWKMVACIRQKSVPDILNAQKSNKIFGSFPLRTLPVIEKDGFLPDAPAKLLTRGSYQIPLISGVNADDGSIFYPLVNSQREELRRNSSFLKLQLIPQFLLAVTDMRGNMESVNQALQFEYFNEVDPANIPQVLSAFVNMSSDSMFVSCNHKTLQLYSATGAPSYMYTFEYKGEKKLNIEEKEQSNFHGASHGDELLYLFNIQNNLTMSTDDQRMSNTLLGLWTNFARTGRSPDSSFLPKWETYNPDSKSYYQIRSTIELQAAYRQRASKLWLDLLPALSTSTGGQILEYRTGGLGWTMLAIALILAVAVVVLGFMLFRKSKSQYFQATAENK